MSERTSLEALRSAFDSAFATELRAPTEHVDVIVLRAGGASFAVRVAELAGVVSYQAVAPLPCDDATALGIAAVRGAILPVYDLAASLGRGASPSNRWMLLAAGSDRVALAFDEIEQYVRVPRGGFVPAAPHGSSSALVPTEVARVGGAMWPVISIAEFLRRLEERLTARTKGQ
jgi:purine-binding chemotaxis protein CheW